MQDAIDKVNFLVEVVNYIKKFEGKVVVIKYGGSITQGGEPAGAVFQDISTLVQLGLGVVLVHGGGPNIDAEMKKRGLAKKTIEGLRVTDEPALEAVSDVLAAINQRCVTNLHADGVLAEDCTNGMFVTTLKDPKLGYVGDIAAVNTKVLLAKLKQGIVPVVSSLGRTADGHLTNINADTAAARLAIALRAEKLTILTNVDSVANARGERIAHINVDDIDGLIADGTIHSGMIPKVRACAEAAAHGVRKAHLINGAVPRTLLIELFTDEGIGTEIVQ